MSESASELSSSSDELSLELAESSEEDWRARFLLGLGFAAALAFCTDLPAVELGLLDASPVGIDADPAMHADHKLQNHINH